MKKFISLAILIVVILLVGCGSKNKDASNSLTVFTAGDYIDPKVLDIFKEETGIKVVYEEFDTNENMYTKITAPNTEYDVVCTSDYMIERLLHEDLVNKLDKSKIDNYKHMDEKILSLSKKFDPTLNYTVPYAYGTLGILYNKKYVDPKEVQTWDALWDKKYADQILMIDSARDLLAVSMKKNGFSLNTSDKTELETVKKDLQKQKSLVQAYVVDQVTDKMIAEEAKLAVIYSGEALLAQEHNKDLEYSVPKEGTNIWLDSWVILKNSKKVNLAHKFINFMSRPDIAAKNYDYLTYSTPNKEAIKFAENESLKDSPIAIPSEDIIKRSELMKYLGKELTEIYNKIFIDIKISN